MYSIKVIDDYNDLFETLNFSKREQDQIIDHLIKVVSESRRSSASLMLISIKEHIDYSLDFWELYSDKLEEEGVITINDLQNLLKKFKESISDDLYLTNKKDLFWFP